MRCNIVHINCFHSLFCSALVLFTATGIATASIVSIPTSFGNGADTELREDESLQRGGARDLNARFESAASNLDFLALRFDLTGIDRSLILNASLELVVTRSLAANRSLDYFGLNSSVAGQNWTEGSANSTWDAVHPFPGLTFDGNINTSPINASNTTYIGNNSWGVAPVAGDILAFAPGSLRDFLVVGFGNLTTFFLTTPEDSGTQLRFASKETTALGETGTGSPVVVSDTFAPRLVLELRDVTTGAVPEATSFLIWGLLGLTFAAGGWKRRER